ncbi:MAG TPA: type I restriction enzyme endonuclease domain-containing protein, partial [Flavipsychrobacter sp.]
DRSNIVVIADEAHRTQYGFEAKVTYIKDKAGKNIGTQDKYGFAKHMRDALPNATYIGFTGTPVESTDRNTKAVFGEYVDVYDIERAVRDGATVPIYYENRFVKLKLNELVYDGLEGRLSEAADNIPEYIVESAVAKATRQESIVGHNERLNLIANDIINHFELRVQESTGKGLIVAMSRKIAVDLYNKIVSVRPQWHSDDDGQGSIKVIMTGASSDDQYLQPHIRSKKGRTAIANRLKDINDPLNLVIVVDMWLTGFDAPILHTMYLDKDMSGHNLMQAIARVNRVFNDKPGGLVVDYVPVTGNLKSALKVYTESGGVGKPTLDITEAVQLMLSKLEVVQQMLHGYNYHEYFTAPVGRKLNILLESEDHILNLEHGKERFLKECASLCKAYALSKSEPESQEVAHEISFFQAVRARLAKFDTQLSVVRRKEFESTIKSLVDSAVSSEGIINLLAESGLQKPTIDIFSAEFMDEIRNMKQKNVAIELLKKLLADQIKIRFNKNIVVNRSFTERLHNAVMQYNNKSLTALEMMELLLQISKEVNEETKRGIDLGLSPMEKAFYDALAVNESAIQMMGDSKLVEIAKELVQRVKRNTTRDWTIRQSAKDRVKLEVKRVLRYHKYPPDDEIRATETVLEQAEMHASDLISEF